MPNRIPLMKTEKRVLGDHAETLVAQHLQKQGFTILERNYRKVYGEIDVIACNKNLIVFVEVKMRTQQYFDLAQLITYSKQKKIMNVAQIYLAQHNTASSCRFDIALVAMYGDTPEITYIQDAFGGNY